MWCIEASKHVEFFWYVQVLNILCLRWLYIVNVCKMHDTQFQKQKLRHLSWTSFIKERILIDKWQSLCLSRNSWSIMKSSGLLQWAQDSAAVRYSEPVESSPRLRVFSLRIILIFSFHMCLCLPICRFISEFHLKSVCIIYSLHSFCMFCLSHTFCLNG